MRSCILSPQTQRKMTMKWFALPVLLIFGVTAAMGFATPRAEAATVLECLGPSGGVPYTPGFWRNKHGEVLIGGDDLGILRFLNLVDANGNAFDPTTFAQFAAWLKAGYAVNMAYMLSVQLAAAELNVFNGAVPTSAVIYAPGTSSADSNGLATLGQIIVEANLALGADGYTPAGDSNRAYQEALKNARDAANNDTNYLQPNCLD